MNWCGLDPPSAYARPVFADDGQVACADADPELFFPRQGTADGRVEDAKAYCQVCDFVDECLDFALRTDQRTGVWGGLTEEERGWVRSGARPRPPRYGRGSR